MQGFAPRWQRRQHCPNCRHRNEQGPGPIHCGGSASWSRGNHCRDHRRQSQARWLHLAVGDRRACRGRRFVQQLGLPARYKTLRWSVPSPTFRFWWSFRPTANTPACRPCWPQPERTPTELSYGTAGIGSTHHLAGELLASMSKTKLLACAVQRRFGFVDRAPRGRNSDDHRPHPQRFWRTSKRGKLKAIATTGPQRWQGLPPMSPLWRSKGSPVMTSNRGLA